MAEVFDIFGCQGDGCKSGDFRGNTKCRRGVPEENGVWLPSDVRCGWRTDGALVLDDPGPIWFLVYDYHGDAFPSLRLNGLYIRNKYLLENVRLHTDPEIFKGDKMWRTSARTQLSNTPWQRTGQIDLFSSRGNLHLPRVYMGGRAEILA